MDIRKYYSKFSFLQVSYFFELFKRTCLPYQFDLVWYHTVKKFFFSRIHVKFLLFSTGTTFGTVRHWKYSNRPTISASKNGLLCANPGLRAYRRYFFVLGAHSEKILAKQKPRGVYSYRRWVLIKGESLKLVMK